jgi:hypothetical protein
MLIGNKLRGVKIENPGNHRNLKIANVSLFPLLGLLVVSIFIPTVTGTLLWIGCVLLIILRIIHMLLIVAFVKAQKGLAIIGIYQIYQIPMYIVIFLALIAFTLKCICYSLDGVWRGMFFHKKYGNVYRDYMNKTSRYIGIVPKSRKRR